MQRSQTLYRFFDERESLLYVGITCNPGTRIGKHRQEKDWWNAVAHIDMERYPSRESVLEAEREAIKRERPLYNIRMNDQKDAEPTIGSNGRWPAFPCGLIKGGVYALGLRDGKCPVGLVVDGDEDGITIALYSWMCGMFDQDTWIRADTVTRWMKAELLSESEKAKRGYLAKYTVFDMDPLATFQKNWGESG